jgi:hypothetical protein
VSTSVTYTAVLDVKRSTAEHLARLLRDQRIITRTRKGRRALGCFRQAVLVLRWFIDGTRLSQLACDHGVSASTAYRYLHEGLSVLAAGAPDLATALERAKAAGLTHLNLDGTVIRTDRVAAPGPNGADLWWSGKHKHHGGNVQGPPSDLHRGQDLGQEGGHRQSDPSGVPSGVPHDQGEHAESPFVPLPMRKRDAVCGLFSVPRPNRAVADVPHHLRVGVHRQERVDVVLGRAA